MKAECAKHLKSGGAACLMAAVLLCGCEKKMSSADGISENVNPDDYGLYDYYSDKYGNEGIVAALWLEDTSWVNYIMVISLDESIEEWGPEDTAVFPFFETFNRDYAGGYFFGLNMNQIVSYERKEKFPAFEWCLSKNKGEPYVHSSSWILPSMSELSMIFSGDIEKLNEAIEHAGGMPIATANETDGLYWTATEDIDDYFHFVNETETPEYDQIKRAIPVLSSNLFFTDKEIWEKHNRYRVRAIKYIYFRCDSD